MANKILQIDLQNDITPQIGSYDNTGGVAPNNWSSEDGVYSLGPINRQGTTPYYWFTPTREVTDFDLCWEDYQGQDQTTPQYHLEIGDSTGNVVLSAFRQYSSYNIGPVNVGELAYRTWHKILVEVRKASASSSTVTIYVDGKKAATGTSATLITSAKIALLGHVPDSYYWQNAGQRLRYVTIYDRSYTSKGINLDGMMTIIRGLISKLIAKLSTVAFTGSYNDLSDKPTISTVNNGTLTIQQNGTTVDSFSANSSTNKTANIQCVDLSTAQTIGGEKTFSNLRTYFGRDISCYSFRKYGKNLNPTSNSYQYLNFGGNLASEGSTNDWSSGYLEQVVDTNGGSRGRWFVQDTSENPVGLELWASGNDKQVRPFQNGNTNLGTSTKKWKSINGINPGALSLPSALLSAMIQIDTTSWVLDGETDVEYTPLADGYLTLANDQKLEWVKGQIQNDNYYGIYRFVFKYDSDIGGIQGVTIPCIKGKKVIMKIKGTGFYNALFTYCQGNV